MMGLTGADGRAGGSAVAVELDRREVLLVPQLTPVPASSVSTGKFWWVIAGGEGLGLPIPLLCLVLLEVVFSWHGDGLMPLGVREEVTVLKVVLLSIVVSGRRAVVVVFENGHGTEDNLVVWTPGPEGWAVGPPDIVEFQVGYGAECEMMLLEYSGRSVPHAWLLAIDPDVPLMPAAVEFGNG